jgi:hypothetical protein
MKEVKQNNLQLQIGMYEAATRQANAAASRARAIMADGLCNPNNEEFCPAAEKRFGEWQEAISETLSNQMKKTGLGLEADPDHFGGESGDPLDYTLDEVRWPLNALEEHFDNLIIHLVRDGETTWQAIVRLLESYQEKGLDGSKL